MNREPLIMFCTSDISGQIRGKAFPARDLDVRLAKGVGWTPTNIMLTPFGPIAEGPWGALGDVLLRGDPATEVCVDFGDEGAREHFFMGDIVETDGTPWDCCPRTFLRDALAELDRTAGLKLCCAFEQEFYYNGVTARPGSGYCLDALRQQGLFGEALVAALIAAGIEPEAFLPEYGPGQYEVTYRPTLGLAAADRAIAVRELTRATALRFGAHASFSPIVSPDSVGNGVHIHMSLRDQAGQPVTHDPNEPHGLDRRAGQFIAGILRHMPALCAWTAPSVISYLRLTPHRWSAAYNNLGYRDREACIRICPVREADGEDVAAQYNFEFRAADSTASPYLALGALVRAGLTGLRDDLPAPKFTQGDPERMSDEERKRLEIVRLPQSLDQALSALDSDALAKGWFPPRMLEAYTSYKHTEVSLMKDLTPEERCARYLEAY